MKYEELVELADEYGKLGKKIVDNLPSDNDECRCDENYEVIDVIHYGNLFNEIHRYCLKCGGIKELPEGTIG